MLVSPGELAQILREVERQRWDGERSQEIPELLALRMAASGRHALLDHVRRIGSFELGKHYRVLRLFDFGAESLVFLGENRDSGETVIVKVPFVDYTDLAHLDVGQLLRRRHRLVHEAELLRVLESTALPSFVGEYTGCNPMFPAGLPPFLRTQEQFLVMEYIQGTRLDALARELHQQERGCCTMRLAVQFSVVFLRLAAEIGRRLGPMAAYTDIKPENALIQGTDIRIVDAASIAREPAPGVPLAVSELYLEPVDLVHSREGTLVPDTAFTLRSLSRCMRLLVSNAPMFVGQAAPDWPPFAAWTLGPSIDSLLARSRVTSEEAATALQEALEQLQCAHGNGPFLA
ncbi:hypothetical protein [Archangium gephyra]|uniref:hypothetical protein n=1 Tax=Archangium gephyra TaxID=48 RepID=UPI003B987EF1